MAVRSLNKAMIIGNLTRDPEIRYTSKGTPVATFGVATNREWRVSEETEKHEEAEFHNVVAWSKLAELCNQLLRKGMKVYIEGRLSTHNWEDAATGKKMYRTEIVADDMIILSYPRSMTTPTGAVEQGEAAVEAAAEAPIVEEPSVAPSSEPVVNPVADEELKDIPF